MDTRVIFTNQVEEAIDSAVEAMAPAGVYVLVDTNTAKYVLPRLQTGSKAIAAAKVLIMSAGEENKNLETLARVWTGLGDGEATRRSVMINVGGGVVTDLGAFAAATFKRGIRFINVPTTLLGAVDASVGGKTGIDFNNLKNEVGVIRQADLVIVSTTFFRTLDSQQMLSGYAEMVKHAALTGPEAVSRLLRYNLADYDDDQLLRLLCESVEVKRSVVDKDLNDNGVRRTLNLGHTTAHALEALALKRGAPIAHGYAVAMGMVVTLVLSRMLKGFPSERLHSFAHWVRETYGTMAITCDDYPELLQAMTHDKKNHRAGEVMFVLLKDWGQPEIDQPVDAKNIEAALDIYRDLMGI